MQPSWSALKRKDLRQHRRYTVENTLLRVAWLDVNGALKMAHDARVLNISEGGIAIELPEAALLLSRVKLQSDKHKLLGQGAVRHCRRQGSKYIVGIEFTDGLRWRAPEGEVTEPIPLSDLNK
jgi:hypothetical protein